MTPPATSPANPSTLPSATVLLPVYNAEAYLVESLESLLRQTHPDFDIFAIDDASTDRSAGILAEYAAKDRRIRILTQPKNGGLVEALNAGLRVATGRYIFRQDGDDRSHPERIRKSLVYLVRNPGTVLLGSDIDCIDATGHELGPQTFPVSDAEIRWQFLFRNPFAHSSVVFEREKALAVGGYDKSALHAEDYDLWTKLAACGRLANLPEILCDYRVHAENITHRHAEAMATGSARTGARYLATLGPRGAALAETWEKFRNRECLRSEEIRTLQSELSTLARTHPDLRDYPRNRADADLAWHFLSYFKRRPFLLRDPRTIFLLLKGLPALTEWPAGRWRTV